MRPPILPLALASLALACTTSREHVEHGAGERASSNAVELRLPALVSDHMVLERERDVRVWGWSEPNVEVVVAPTWTKDVARARVGADGRWLADVRTPRAGGPYAIEVRAGSTTKRVGDVMIGELWLASGQSNMEMPIADVGGSYTGVADWKDDLARASRPRIRFFDVANTTSAIPRDDCEGVWRVATPESARSFSATAWFFARALEEALDVPIGVVTADWGGTPAEAWTSVGALRAHGGFEAALEAIEAERASPGSRAETARLALGRWRKRFERIESVGAARMRVEPWSTMRVPSTWSGALAGFDGVAWYRRAVRLPLEWTDRELLLELPPIDDMDAVYFDGVEVGATREMGHWNERRRYVVPARLVRHEAIPEHVIEVRVLDTGGLGGIGVDGGDPREAELRPRDVPSGHGIALAGEWWFRASTDLATLGAMPSAGELEPWMPSALHSGMIAPLANARFAGAIWYQGEANVARWREYRTLFPALIADWRATFESADLPFGFVQIAPFAYPGDRGEAARLREAQERALVLPSTGMAATLDVGDANDIHPKQKRVVGERLARWALATVYGKHDVEHAAPRFASVEREGNTLRVRLANARGLAAIRDVPPPIVVAGSDRRFATARATIDGETLVVESELVPEPVAVRYAFHAFDHAAFVGASGLPLLPFRSDDWDD